MPTAPQHLRARKSGWPAAPPRPAPVDYPDRGVEAMTPIHRQAMNAVILPLEDRYGDRSDVYIGGDMTMYWQEGDEERWVQPDVFVAFGPSRDRERRVWKSWEEGKFADFVLEVASRGTHRRDQTVKRAIYESQGVTEYWQHDPTGEFLPPLLLGHRLNAKGVYEAIPLEAKPDGTRYGESKVVALHLCLDSEGCLRLYDPATGEFLLTHNDTKRELAEERRLSAQKDREIEQLKRRLANR